MRLAEPTPEIDFLLSFRAMDPQEHSPSLQTATSSSLLEGLKDMEDRTRWEMYVDRYRPLIVSFSRRRGLGEEDAEDLAQTALLEFSRSYRDGRYDPEKGRLRSWLFGIVRRQLLSFWRGRRRETPVPAVVETECLEQLNSEGELEQLWHEEWQKAVLGQCLCEVRGQMQARTYEAFEEFALKDRPVAEVARNLGLTGNAVYSAKRRVVKRLRGILHLMEDIW